MDFPYNQYIGYNPLLRSNFIGLNIVGRLGPTFASASDPYDISFGGGFYIPALYNTAPVWNQVVDWPFSSDEFGMSFPTSDIWGVRSVCLNRNPDPCTGYMLNPSYTRADAEYYTAVPKTLPAGYTIRNAHDFRLGGSWVDEHADGPYSGSILTPSGATTLTNWTPMNFNQLTYPASIDVSPTSANFWGSSAFGGPSLDIYYIQSIGSHVGFRNGQCTFSFLDVTLAHVITRFSLTLYIGYLGSGQVLVQPSVPGDPPGFPTEVLWSHTFTEGDGVGPTNGTKVVTFNGMGEMTGPDKVRLDLYAWAVLTVTVNDPADDPQVGPGGGKNVLFHLAPRVDIPLWFTQSGQGNRVAPGGIPS